MKLRILHITQFLGVGGLEKVLFLLASEQIQAGHEAEILVYGYEQTWANYFESNGIKVDTSFVKKEGYDIKLLKYLSQKIRSFDIIHTHDLNPLMYMAPLKLVDSLKRRNQFKLIHTTHGLDHIRRTPRYKFYERLCATQSNFTIGVSQNICEYYHQLGIPPKKVLNINNGTPISKNSVEKITKAREHLRNSLSLDPNKKIWTSVARVLPSKDQKIICELAHRYPNHVFLLIGPSGDDQYWNKIINLKPTNVFMLGARSDITELLLGSDYFISASHHEGIPISVLEAGSLSVPCLLSDIPGHRIIASGITEEVATFFKMGDINDLSKKASILINNHEKSNLKAKSLHEHVKSNFSAHHMFRQYLDIYLGNNVN